MNILHVWRKMKRLFLQSRNYLFSPSVKIILWKKCQEFSKHEHHVRTERETGLSDIETYLYENIVFANHFSPLGWGVAVNLICFQRARLSLGVFKCDIFKVFEERQPRFFFFFQPNLCDSRIWRGAMNTSHMLTMLQRTHKILKDTEILEIRISIAFEKTDQMHSLFQMHIHKDGPLIWQDRKLQQEKPSGHCTALGWFDQLLICTTRVQYQLCRSFIIS